MTAKLKPHPYADTYPMMSAEEMAALTEDIRANGQEQPIILYQGMILDGRNRYQACQAAGVEPKTVEFDGDDAKALAKVRSLNDHRREMTPGKWALVAARQWKLQRDGGINNPPGNGKLRTTLAKHFRVGEVQLRQARDLLEKAEDLASEVEAGIPLAAAYAALQERCKEAEQKNRDMSRVAHYREQVERGELKLEEAIQRIMKEEREQKEKEQIEASARSNWLEEFEEHLAWFEAHVCPCKDGEFPWFTEPGSPGMFDHKITPERITEVERHLARARKLGFEVPHVRAKGGQRHPRGHQDSRESKK